MIHSGSLSNYIFNDLFIGVIPAHQYFFYVQKMWSISCHLFTASLQQFGCLLRNILTTISGVWNNIGIAATFLFVTLCEMCLIPDCCSFDSKDSCGFEHVFVGETKFGNEIAGFHNWVQFYLQEKSRNLDYKGYKARDHDIVRVLAALFKHVTLIKITFTLTGYQNLHFHCSFKHVEHMSNLPVPNQHRPILWIYFCLTKMSPTLSHLLTHAQPDQDDHVLNLQFSWHGLVKPVGSAFVGASPEFEMALYTIIFLANTHRSTTVVVNIDECQLEVVVVRHGRSIGTAYPKLLSSNNRHL